MSVILQTRDNIIVVVPRTLLSYWEVFSSLEEAVGNNFDVVPIPLTSEQTDIWLDLTVRLQLELYVIEEYGENELSLLNQDEATLIARSMDAKNTEWYLYCNVQEEGKSDGELKQWYKEVGRLYIDMFDLTFEHDWYDHIITGTLVEYDSYDTESDEEENCLILLGVLYCDMVRTRTELKKRVGWIHVSWNTVVRLGVAEVIASYLDGENTVIEKIPQNVLILCYDGIHTPPVPEIDVFTAFRTSIIYGFDRDLRDMTELYKRIMRCCIATMEKYPEQIGIIARHIGLSDPMLDNVGSFDHLHHIRLVHRAAATQSSLHTMTTELDRESTQLYVRAQLLYHQYEVKKYTEIVV